MYVQYITIINGKSEKNMRTWTVLYWNVLHHIYNGWAGVKNKVAAGWETTSWKYNHLKFGDGDGPHLIRVKKGKC